MPQTREIRGHGAIRRQERAAHAVEGDRTMPRSSLALRFKCLLTRHPVLANRVNGLIGARRIETVARRTAIKAARRAYARVPFYRAFFERHGFDATRMRRLTWEDFAALPPSGKRETEGAPDRDLLDGTVPSPAGDSLLGRSSGTTSGPVTWPAGWDEFELALANLWRMVREVQGHRVPMAVVSMLSVDGGDLAGNMPFRSTFTLKERTRWPFEVFAAGEEADTVLGILRWLAEQRYESLLIISFPGTMERLLDRAAELRLAAAAGAGVDWSRFKRIHVILSGQLASVKLRRRVRDEIGLDQRDVMSNTVVYAASDTGGIIAQTTPFTAWLERYLEQHPDLYAALGVAEEHRTKPIMECITPLAIYMEQDEDGALLLTSWKHRPLIRYRSNDLAWLQPSRAIVRTLDRYAPTWRRDFKAAGYGRAFIPKAAPIGMILGRADDTRIVNGANVSPDMLRQALEAAGILPRLHHFKHDTDDARPNEYLVYLELNDEASEAECAALAKEWRALLLDTLVHLPAASDLYAAHRSNPVVMGLTVRARGTGEFAGDDTVAKRRYVLGRGKSAAAPTAEQNGRISAAAQMTAGARKDASESWHGRGE
jgi:phenylacetate-coenzyme A ligase PaaK-like adenylate-forming protein